MRLATPGMSYERVGNMLGFAKSMLCKWIEQEQYKCSMLLSYALELDDVLTRVVGGNMDLKIARDCACVCEKLERRGAGGARYERVSA